MPQSGIAYAMLALIAATATLGLAALRPVLFLRANEAQAAAMLANNAGSLDAFCEPAEKLLEAFRLTEFNTHALTHHPFAIVQLATPATRR
jgi:hypothetical protein